jgi:acetyltransferase-like isoleucine patch superfamily enzyme
MTHQQALTTDFTHAPAWVEVRGNFAANCQLTLAAAAVAAGQAGRLKLKIVQHGNMSLINHAQLDIAALSGNIAILIGNHHAHVTFGANSAGAFDLRLWRDSVVMIGQQTTSNGVRIVCDRSTVVLGDDCMLSDSILLQAADQHGIVDLASGDIINDRPRSITLGKHVWLGRQCTLMPDCEVGEGSIIGTGAIVTRTIPPCSVAVGVPAQVVKEAITWSRSPVALDTSAQQFVSAFQAKNSC